MRVSDKTTVCGRTHSLAWVLIAASVITQVKMAGASTAAKVAIIYHSETNYTRTLAQAVSAGAVSKGAITRVLSIAEASFERDVLEWADAVIIGCPTHYGNPSAAMLAWIESDWEKWWTDPRLSTMYGGVFASGGGMSQGVEHVVTALSRVLWSFRISVVTPDPSRSGYTSYGAVAITGTPPFNLTNGNIATGFVDAAAVLGSAVVSRVNHHAGEPAEGRWHYGKQLH